MKKIAIVTRRLVMGGIEKALLSMLEAIPKDKYEITLIVMGTGGELEDDIPKHVKVICMYGYERTTVEKIKNSIKKGNFNNAFKVGWYTFLSKTTDSVFQQEMYHSKMLPKIETEFDLAIAYHTPASFPVIYVITHLKAKKKVAWIHADVFVYKKELQPYWDYYNQFDGVLCVSAYARNNFVEMYPHLKERTSVLYNILDEKKMKILAGEHDGYSEPFDGIRLLTVGRLDPQKGQDYIPAVLKRLVEEGHKVKWYLVGEGWTRMELERNIEELGLEGTLILLGTKHNPYPYIKKCDIYVQPSRHEGYCITLAEARAFNRPIIATDFVGAREQIEHGEEGIIINLNEDEIYEAIKNLIVDTELRNKFQHNLARKKVNTTLEINKLFEYIG